MERGIALLDECGLSVKAPVFRFRILGIAAPPAGSTRPGLARSVIQADSQAVEPGIETHARTCLVVQEQRTVGSRSERDVVIFDPPRPIPGDGKLDACAQGPAQMNSGLG